MPSPVYFINSQNSTYLAPIGHAKYVLANGNVLTTPGAYNIDASADVGGRTFQLNGEMITNTNGAGLVVGTFGSMAAGNRIFVGETGFIHGDGAGVLAFGASNIIDISGTITSTSSWGAAVSGLGNTIMVQSTGYIDAKIGLLGYGAGSKIVNHGYVEGDSAAVQFKLSGGTVGTLINTGHLVAANNAIYGSAGDERITNRGIIDGDVQLFGGNDVFSDRFGHVNGVVAGGEGNDTYIMRGPAFAVTEGMGQGFDTIKSSHTINLPWSVEQAVLLGKGNFDIIGGAFAEILTGNAGNNDIFGASGFDTINGRGGNDTLTGGLHADTFVFGTNCGQDIVMDFVIGEDSIDLQSMSAIVSFADLIANHAFQDGNDVEIVAGSDRIVLKNTHVFNLVEGDFII